MSSQELLDRSEQMHTLLESAQNGSSKSLGKLLETCREYLLLVANQTLDHDLQAKVGPSDLVQETFLHARITGAIFRAEMNGNC